MLLLLLLSLSCYSCSWVQNARNVRTPRADMETNVAATISSTNVVSTIKNHGKSPSYREITGFLAIFVAGSVSCSHLQWRNWQQPVSCSGKILKIHLVLGRGRNVYLKLV
jgi:hypothetical protein